MKWNRVPYVWVCVTCVFVSSKVPYTQKNNNKCSYNHNNNHKSCPYMNFIMIVIYFHVFLSLYLPCLISSLPFHNVCVKRSSLNKKGPFIFLSYTQYSTHSKQRIRGKKRTFYLLFWLHYVEWLHFFSTLVVRKCPPKVTPSLWPILFVSGCSKLGQGW